MPAGITDKLRKYKSLFSTTLSTSIGTGTSDTITPASVTGLPTDTAITLTFDRVDSGGVATPTKLERIRGIISGGNFTAYVRGKDGTTEQAHTAGAVIEMIWNADDLNDMVDHGLVQHNQDGTHKAALVTTLKATAAEVATGTDDTKIVTPLAATGIARKSIITGTSNSVSFTAGTTQYISSVGIHSSAYAIAIPMAGVLKNLYVYSGSAPGVDKNIVCVVMANNVETAITCTISGNETNTANDTTHSASVAAGVRIALKIVSTAGATQSDIIWAVEFDAS